MNRRHVASSLLLALAFLLASGTNRLGLGGEDESRGKRVTLLYTTDIHGHYLPHEDGKGHKSGGVAALFAKVQELRTEAKNPVFLFDSGDVMTGHPVSDLDYQGVTGGALLQMMNVIGYDAWCLGNHDFDHGRANTSKMVAFLKFPTVCANLVAEGEPLLKTERWRILEKDGVKVGVFGLMTEHFAEVTGRERVHGITATRTATAASEAVAALASRCDLIVALSHCGSDDDVKLADQVGGIQVILSGHNHRSLKPALHGKTLIAEGDIWAKHLGQLDITVRGGEITYHKGKLHPLEPHDATGELKSVLDEVHEAVGKRLEEVVAKLEAPWSRNNKGESNIGDFFADGLRAFAKADCAFLNSGGIRSNLPAGNVTLGDIYEIFPFDNSTVSFELTGEDLIKAIEKNATAAVADEYGVLQVSGIRYDWKKNGRRAQVVRTEIAGAPIDPKKVYRCAAIDFIALDQHEKYFGPGVTVANPQRLNVTMTKVAEDWVRDEGKKGPIRASLDHRMHELN